MSLDELKSFLYKGPRLNLLRDISSDLSASVDANITKLVNENKGDDVIKSIQEYANSYVNYFANKQTNTNLDTAMLALAVCSRLKKSEEFSHLVYKTLIEISQTPFHLFAFMYYRKRLVTSSSGGNESRKGAHSGRGLKKAINKWYNKQVDLLYLLTAFKRSHYWSNKDLFKLYHIKASNESVNFVVNYVMFGYDKVKTDDKFKNEQKSLEFIKDLDDLKTLKSGSQIADLIKKNKFTLNHLPSRQRKFKEIWPALLENMNSQELCENLHFILKHDVLNETTEQLILNKILNLENPYLTK